MAFPEVVIGNSCLVATSKTQTSRFVPVCLPNAIDFPSGDHEGHVSSVDWPSTTPLLRRISSPPSAATLKTWNFAKMIFPSMVFWWRESTSFATYAIHFASADQVGCPGLPVLLVTCRAISVSDSPPESDRKMLYP